MNELVILDRNINIFRKHVTPHVKHKQLIIKFKP